MEALFLNLKHIRYAHNTHSHHTCVWSHRNVTELQYTGHCTRFLLFSINGMHSVYYKWNFAVVLFIYRMIVVLFCFIYVFLSSMFVSCSFVVLFFMFITKSQMCSCICIRVYVSLRVCAYSISIGLFRIETNKYCLLFQRPIVLAICRVYDLKLCIKQKLYRQTSFNP